MNRRSFLKAIGIGAASLTVGGCESLSRVSADKLPEDTNVVFILVDDMGWSDLPCYGNTFHETPNIDRLAAEGMRFTDAYAACPVCSPTRASIMSGQYPAHIGITDFIPGHWRPYEDLIVPENRLHMPLETVTVAEALKRQGYTTGYIGKWHLGGKPYLPENQGFDNVAYGVKNQGDKKVSGFTDEAVTFIEENRDNKFFLFLSHHTVHIRLEAPDKLVDKYRRKPKPATGVNNPVYAAMIEHLDDSTGRIMDKLDSLGLTEKTLFIFYSDNGGLYKPYGGYGGDMSPVCSNAPLRGEKGTLYEGGIREPLIVRWPGVVEPGAVCRDVVTSVDFYPTLLDVCGANRDPAHVLDGETLMPLLTHQGGLTRQSIYWHYPHYHHSEPAGAIRHGRYKLIEFFEDGRLELYDLEADLGERNNLVAELPGMAAHLQEQLAAWRQAVDAKMPKPNPNHDPARAHEWGRHPSRR